MNFFFDRNMPRRIARMLEAYDSVNTVTHQDDDNRFDQNTPDVGLIATLAGERPSPVLLTADEAMQRNVEERSALAGSRLTIVFFRPSWHDLNVHTQACKLLALWPELIKETGRCREPTAFEVTSSARKMERLCLTRELQQGVQRKPRR